MKKKLIACILLALIILVIIVVMVIILLVNNPNSIQDNWDYTNKDDDNVFLEQQQQTYLIVNKILYFSIRDNVLEPYIRSLANKNHEQIYDMLSENYKDKNDVTKDNVLSKMPTYNIVQVFPQHMYMKEGDLSDNIYIYNITQNSTIKDNYEMETKNIEEYYKVILDKQEQTFSIEPITQTVYNQGINNELAEDNTNIEKNMHNIFKYNVISEDYIVEKYLDNYINLLKNNTQRAYEIVEEEYKSKKYNNDYRNFEKSIKTDILKQIYLESYEKIYTENNDIKYICKDQFGNVYIFNEIAAMEYTVELDSYTIEHKEIYDKYRNLSDKEKVEHNINKFFEMIGNQEYSIAYELLNKTFKEEKFPTEESFKNYIEDTLYRYNEIDYTGYSNKISSVHVTTIRLTDATKKNVEEINFSIVMQLLEGNKFNISFSR